MCKKKVCRNTKYCLFFFLGKQNGEIVFFLTQMFYSSLGYLDGIMVWMPRQYFYSVFVYLKGEQKQWTKFISAKCQKMFCPSYTILRIKTVSIQIYMWIYAVSKCNFSFDALSVKQSYDKILWPQSCLLELV